MENRGRSSSRSFASQWRELTATRRREEDKKKASHDSRSKYTRPTAPHRCTAGEEEGEQSSAVSAHARARGDCPGGHTSSGASPERSGTQTQLMPLGEKGLTAV